MIFLVVGVFLTILGCLFLFIPSKGNLPFYGYHSPRATKSDVHWRLAQKTSGKYFFIFGLLMALIGYLLKLTGQTNYFIIEMLVLVFPIMPIFILTEKKLQELDDSIGGNKNEYFNDRR
ncbi:SdpI family protein [Enterococcus hirae]|uniref:SdpI family protein n=1 Tax=Enterococcus hirae TaxID=1354 RepID=UPI00339612E1